MKTILIVLLTFSFSLANGHEEEVSAIVLGSGVGALTTATYLSRAGITPVVITGPEIGGTIGQSHHVENWPGEVSIPGFELSEKIRVQAEFNGAIFREEEVVSVDFSKQPYAITTKSLRTGKEQRYLAKACIIAMGATPNLLGVPGESGREGYWSKGVYSCAVCDGSLYRDRPVAVVGGGDAALIEAQYLANIASEVHLIVRGKQFRSIETRRMEEILSHPKIRVHFQNVVREVKGDGDKVTHLLIEESDTRTRKELRVDALFLAIGSRPNTELFRGELELDSKGYIVLKKHQQTSKEGIYAIGDVADPEFKQAISAAGDGAKAALQAQQFVAFQTEVVAKGNVSLSNNVQPIAEIGNLRDLEKAIAAGNGPVFVDFYSTRCGPCRMFSPMYESWAKKYGGKISFLKVNADAVPEAFERYQIRGVPTLIIFDEKGRAVRKSIGLQEIFEVDRVLEKIEDSSSLSSQSFK